MTTATQEITVRVSRTIQVPSEASQGDQYDKYEPLLAEVVIRETCPKKKYAERLDELIDLASAKVIEYLEGGEELPEGEEIQASGGEGDELLEEGLAGEGEYEEEGGGEGGEEGFEEGQGEEGFEEGQGEEGLGEEGFEGSSGEEGEGEGFEGEGEGEFGDFFDDDPGAVE